jgi:hypothetical protein
MPLIGRTALIRLLIGTLVGALPSAWAGVV